MLRPGTCIGAYEVVAFVGAGGMGEVYRARDRRLGRVVALKLLPDTLLPHPESVARFRREAQLLASLNHPNIAVIYGFEEAEHRHAIALEFVEGEGLDARLASGPLALEEVVAIARQIAEGLEAAHERGIIHRDLKPGNVRVTGDGRVKILDFGLAKALDPSGEGPTSRAADPTVAPVATTAGMIVGTVAYMAPEQARGKAVDKRADIWAFGVLLFEMLAGQRLFEGETASDTLAAVLTGEVDLGRLPPTTPDAIRMLLRRCLEREATLRLRDIGEARIALSAASGLAGVTPARGLTARAGTRGTRALPLVAAAAVGGLIVGAAMQALSPPSRAGGEPLPLLTVGIETGAESVIAGAGWVGLNWVGPTAVLSPDGRTLVFIARGGAGGRWQLHLRRLDELNARALAGTEGAYAPFFSPDGGWLGFFADGRLSKLELSSGTVTPLTTVEEARGGAWSEHGSIVFAPRPDGPLYRVASSGGRPEQATKLDSAAGETTHRWPQFLPGGRTLLFTAHGNAGVARGGDIIVQTEHERRTIHRGGLFGRYSPSGHLLYVNDGTLFAAPFDRSRLALSAPGAPVADEIAHSPINGTAQYSLSDTGLLSYRRARSPNRSLQWMDPSGQIQPLRSVPAEYQEARISPDRSRVLLAINEGMQSDVWIYTLKSDAISRLTFYADNDWSPIWSPDSQRVAYSSWRPDVGTFNLFLHRSDGSGEPQRLTTSRHRQSPIDWHPAGKYLLFSEDRLDTGTDLLLLPLDATAGADVKTGPPQPFLATPSNELAGEFSPDGKWIAYTSDESGRNEVFVRPFPGGAGRWQVSTEGAEWVEWPSDGQLFYGISEDVVMRVRYRVEGSTFIAEKPQVWMRIPAGVVWVDPVADGNRAIVIRSADARTESVVLMVNFVEQLRRRAQSRR